MKDNLNSIAADTARVALNMMTPDELRTFINVAACKLEEKAERHRIAIEQAIADAIDDGFDVSFWVEGTKDCCVMCHDDEENRIKHVRVN